MVTLINLSIAEHQEWPKLSSRTYADEVGIIRLELDARSIQ